MKPRSYGPFPYSPIIDRPRLEWPNGAHVALWIIPNIEYFSMQEKPGGYGAGGKIPDVVMWSRARLRQPRRRVPHHGHARPLRHPRHGRAQLEPVRRASRASWRRARSASGSGWATTRATPAASTKPAPGEEAQIIRNTLDTIEKHTGKPAEGLAQLRPAGDLGHARSSRRRTASNTSPTGATTISPIR